MNEKEIDMARPTIIGTVIRRIDMNHSSHGKDKDYRITVTADGAAYRVYTEYGPAGRLQNGKEQSKVPLSADQADALTDQLRYKKQHQADAYQVISDQYFERPDSRQPPPARRPSLSKDVLSEQDVTFLSIMF